MIVNDIHIEELFLELNKAGIELWVEEGRLRSRAPEGAITANLRNQIKEHLEQIITFLENQQAVDNRLNLSPSIPLVAAQTDYVLSNAQRRLWVFDQVEEKSIAYNIPVSLKLKGALNIAALEQSFQLLIERHEILRTNFVEERQIIHPATTIKLPVLDYTNSEEASIQAEIETHATYVFDLAKDRLLRLTLLKTDIATHILLINMHHIISDGWSTGILIKELSALYQACSQGLQKPLSILSPLSIQYKDYATWQAELLKSEQITPLRQFWLEELTPINGQLPIVDLPTDFPRPAIKTTNGADCAKMFDKAIIEQFKKFTQSQGATLFMGLTALIKTVLYRYTGQTDLLIGTPTAGRNHPDLQAQIGFYVNTLVLRNQLDGEQSFTDFLKKVKENTLQAFDNDFYPFDLLVEELGLPTDRSRSPIFDVMLVLQNNEKSSLKLGEVNIIPEERTAQVSRFDLIFKFSESLDNLNLSIEYNTDLFKADRIDRLMAHLETLIESVLVHPNTSIDQLNLLPTSERQLLLETFNDTSIDFPAEQTIIDLFEVQVERSPDKIAVVFEDSTWTYQQLNEKANQIGHYLQNKYKLQPNDLVALQLERSEWTVLTILGILKAGAVYLPIATNMPTTRVEYLLETSQAKLLLADTPNYKAAHHAFAVYLPIVNIETANTAIFPINNPVSVTTALDLAVVMFTSGSTGQPKGVSILHQNICKFSLGNDYVDYREGLISLHHSDYSFDALTLELWPPLLNGAKLVLMPSGERTIDQMIEVIQAEQISIIWITAGLFHLMVDNGIENLTSLKYLMTGGDVVSVAHVNKALDLLPNCTIINGYGPTENTVFTTTCNLRKLDKIEHTVPIGYPISNTQVFILDQNQQLVPIGIAGELCTSGKGLAKGYLNQPKLTAKKFIPHPFIKGKRLYRTGDMARWLPDGKIEFLGRVDFQLKIRGYLIETPEIEQALLQHSAVESVVVIGYPIEKTGHKELVAYIVTTNGVALPSVDTFRAFLGETLPSYMIPSYFMELATFPLTNRGKVNRKALPTPKVADMGTGDTFVAPETPTEKTLATIWVDLLGRKTIGIHDNFFNIGGNSLRALRLLSLIKQQFSEKLSLSQIFVHSTIHKLAIDIDKKTLDKSNNRLAAIPRIDLQESYELSNAQRRLWVLQQIEGMQSAYNIPTAVRLKGQVDYKALGKSIQFLFERHEALRTYFVDGRQMIRPSVEKNQLIRVDYTKAEASTIQAHIQAQQAYIFDLEKDSLLKIELLKLSSTEHILLFNAHHIIFDGWSMGIFTRELSTLYTALSQHIKSSEVVLPTLSIQYKDYAAWQHNLLETAQMTSLKQYWFKQLATVEGQLPTLNLPTDFPRPLIRTTNGAHIKKVLSITQLHQLKTLLQTQEATLFMGLTALVKVLLYRYTGQKDLIIGTPTAGRSHPDLHNQIGVYINTLVLRNQINEADTFNSFLGKVKNTALEAFEYEQYPFDRLVEDLDLPRDTSRSAIFDVMLMVQNNETTSLRLGDLEIMPETSESIVSKFDITFSFTETKNGLSFNIEYNTDLFKSPTIERLHNHFETLVDSVLANPMVSIDNFPILSLAEHQMITEKFNDTTVEFPSQQTFIDLFEAQVEKTPNKIAFIFNGENGVSRKLTYQQLNERANQLGHSLIEKYELQTDDIIALQLDRSEWMLIAILGVLKAGAAYLPIAPDFPKSRVSYMLQDSQAKTLLTDTATFETAKQFKQQINIENIEQLAYDTLDTQNLKLKTQNADLAYVLYTSGSTGNPKGVMIEHRALVNFLWSMQQRPGLTKQDVLLSITNYTFDISILEFGLPLINGAQLVLASTTQQTNPALLETLIAKTKPTFFQATPSLWSILLNSEISHLANMKLLCGGEALPTQLAQKLIAAGREVWNMYGPTETTIWSSVLKLEQDQLISIGQPIGNTDMYVLGKDLQVLPIGIIGELHIGGAGLARGYLNNPELTAKKFIPHPFKAGARLYKTGDLARWLPDGNIEFFGRVDHQLKIRGYRIEAGEIENLLIQHPNIKQATVLATGTGANKELVAYYVSSADQPKTIKKKAPQAISNIPEKGLHISLFHWGDTSMNKTTSNPYNLLMQTAAFADENGFEGIWIPERHFDPWGGQFPSPSILAGAIASTTKRIKIRSGSVVAPLHHPIRIAENWSVVDNLSNGRVQMSFASGWAKNDFVLQPENYKNRRQIVFDYLEIVEKLWAGEQVAYPDPDGKEVLTEIYPKPIQPKLPAFITVGKNPKSVIRAAQKGKFLLTHLLGKDWEEVREMVKLYRKTWKEAGHPGEGYVAVMVHTFMGADRNSVRKIVEAPLTKFLKNSTMLAQKNTSGAEAEVDATVQNRIFRAAFNRYYNEIGLFGTVDHCVETVAGILDMGVNEIACLIDFGIPTQTVVTHLPFLKEFNHRIYELTKGKTPTDKIVETAIPIALTDVELTTPDFRTYLKQSLPSYMVPSAFIKLAEIPLTASGKVNRKALPAPIITEDANSTTLASYIAPSTPTEKTLAQLWETILKKEKIGLKEDFFDLGGHSLHAIRLGSLIQKELKVAISLIEIFTNPTIAALSQLIAQKELVLFQHIPTVPIQESYELSNAQRRIWVLNQLEEAEIAFNMPQAAKLSGQVNQEAIEQSINLLFERHESLRTNIVKGQQVIRSKVNFTLKTFDYTDADRATIQAHIQAHATHVFDLEKDVLLKMELLKVDATAHVLLFNMHHIISDGWSMGILANEFSKLYEAIKNGVEQPLSLLAPLSIQYKDFSAWQNALLESEQIIPHRQFWLEKLALIDGQLPVLEIPTDFPRPLIRTSNGASAGQFFDPQFLNALQQLVKEQDTTLFITLTALLKVLFYRYTGQKDIIIGTPTAGRNHPDLYNQIGFYINTVVLRNQINGQHTFKDFLGEVKRNSLETFEHEIYPFNRLVDELDLPKDMSRSPIFDVLIAIQNIDQGALTIGTTTKSEEKAEVVSSKFDLTFNFTESQNGLYLGIEYNTDLFQSATIERFISHFETLVQNVVANPTTIIDTLNILPVAEQQLLKAFNNTSIDFPLDQTAIEVFEAQVEKTPDNTVIIYEGQSLTYRQLNEKVNQLAHYLRDKFNIQPNDVVPMYLERSEWMIIAILGIQKAGGAYLPVAANLPESRIIYMLGDCQAKVLLTDKGTHALATELSFPIAIAQIEKISHKKSSNPTLVNTPTDLAYIIYTSGSTGKPKGVQGIHRGLINRLSWIWRQYPFAVDEVCCQKTNISFVDSISEIYEPLLGGIPSVIIPDATLLNPPKLVELFNTHKITRIILVPSLLKVILEYLEGKQQTLPYLKHWATSGEALKLAHVQLFKQVLPAATLLNLYGSSEISDATHFNTKMLTDKVLIGKPTANMQVSIVDKTDNLVPVGIYGELYVSGDSLASGYLNKSILTKEKFVNNPFGSGIIYKTGDLGRWLPDGNIEYFGRVDHQLKIRGYRIEAGAVEQALMAHPAIESAVVVGYQKEDSIASGEETTKELAAYLIATPEITLPAISTLRRFLSQNLLPDYMIPTYFVVVEAFPKTAGGKIDRKYLPIPNESNLATGTPYVAARNVTEQMLVSLWEEIIDRSPIGIHDDFSDIGGHSLRAIQLSSQLQERYDLDIPLTIILQYPTIAGLATRIMEQRDFENQSSILYNPAAQPTIFAFPSIFGLAMGYYELASHCPENSWYSFDFLVAENRLALYYEQIKQQQPEGPYLFFGFSAGGNLAYEMVRYMEEKGDTVSDLIILDSFIFLAPTSFDFEEYIGNIRKVENQKKEVLALLDNENIINQSRERTSTYLDFLNKTKITGTIQANIHYLLADWEEGAEQWRLGKDWSIYTEANHQIYPMQGTHTQVFTKSNILTNAKVIKDILTEIEKVTEPNSKELSISIPIK